MDMFATLEDDPIASFFESLGYSVGWDCDLRLGERWYEVSDKKGMFVQIDMGVPLEHLRQDFTDHLAGREMSSESDYDVRGPGSKRLERFMRRVAGDQ